MKTITTLIFMVFISVGVAHATPAKIEDRAEYSASLNSIASVIMTWYGSLITASDSTDQQIKFHTENISAKWNKYRSQYPKNIYQIVITGTELLKQNEDYYFTVHSNVSFRSKDDKAHTYSLKELFIFNNSILKNVHNHPSYIRSVSLLEKQEQPLSSRTGYNRKHYKVREFTYAWLSYLEGVNSLNSVMNADTWIEKAPYTLEIGSNKSKDSVQTTLKKRNKLLAKGGHLLRSIAVNPKGNNTFNLELILEWKGVNKNNSPVIAKIIQVLEIHIKPDKTWEVLSIKEKHLLPIVGPWMGLLC